MKNILKTSLVACSLLAFGFTITSQVSAATDKWSKTADVNLAVNEWNLTIGTTDEGTITSWWTVDGNVASINLGTGDAWDTLSWKYESNSAFYVSDLKWSATGWYTTVQVSDLSGKNTDGVITKDHVFFKAWEEKVNLMTWTANTAVVIDSTRNDYVAMTTALTYIKRDNWAEGAHKLWIYGNDPRLKVEIPLYTPADQYKGIITYTLYEND